MSSSNGWSPERRQRQREAIQRWRPWERSTGPRTPEGKAKASSNSLVHGLYDAASRARMQAIHTLLREAREMQRRMKRGERP